MKRSTKKSTATKSSAWRRLRQWMGSVTAVLLVVGLVALVWSTLQTQRLVGLRQQAFELEKLHAEAQVRRDAVRDRLNDARRYVVIAERARSELGMIDSDATRRAFVALPTTPAADEGLVARWADRLDRFSGVRSSNAAEREAP